MPKSGPEHHETSPAQCARWGREYPGPAPTDRPVRVWYRGDRRALVFTRKFNFLVKNVAYRELAEILLCSTLIEIEIEIEI